MFKQPTKFLYPLDPNVDYRLPENRQYAMFAWAEAMYMTGELDQQLRLMNHCVQTLEGKLWLAFLWSCCYNFTGPWVIMSEFPTPPQSDEDKERFKNWYNEIFDDFRVDTDCRYRKSKMIEAISSYTDWLDGRSQQEAIMDILTMRDVVERYNTLWNTCESWKFQGRLSTWNYVEAVALVTNRGFAIDCQDFMLDDITGSESNRNGACWVLGREELQTKHGIVKETGERLDLLVAQELNTKAEEIFIEMQAKLGNVGSVLRLNVETIFCWFKKKFRERSSRVLFWDAQRTYEEIKYVEDKFPSIDCSGIWEARMKWLPKYALCEHHPEGVLRGVNKEAMKVFINTGTLPDVMAFQNGEPWYWKEGQEFNNSKSTAKSLFD